MASENQLCGKGYELTLFLFTDILVVAKRKSNKTLSISRSPSTASLAGAGTLGHGQGLLQAKVCQCLSCTFRPICCDSILQTNLAIAGLSIWLRYPATHEKGSSFPLSKGNCSGEELMRRFCFEACFTGGFDKLGLACMAGLHSSENGHSGKYMRIVSSILTLT